MRRVCALVLIMLLSGCAAGLAERKAELSHWVGVSESQLVGAIGAPNRTYEAGGTKFLTYDTRRR